MRKTISVTLVKARTLMVGRMPSTASSHGTPMNRTTAATQNQLGRCQPTSAARPGRTTPPTYTGTPATLSIW